MARDRISFGHGLDVTKIDDTRVRVDIDESEVDPGGELEGTLADAAVKADHAGSTHQSILDSAGDTAVAAITPHTTSESDVHGIVSTGDLETMDGAQARVDAHAAEDDPHPGYQTRSERGAAGGYASLDSSGLVPVAQLPASTTNNVWPVASQAAMLALSAVKGDMAIRSDVGKTFVLSTNSPSTLGDWLELPPGTGVDSVNGRTGVVTGVQDTSERGTANGYAALDSGGKVPDAQIPAAVARDSEVSSAVTTHEGADSHAIYQKSAQRAAANGYASLDGSGKVPDAQIASTITRDTEVVASVATHNTDTAAHATFARSTDVTSAVATHEAASDPHSAGAGYQRKSEKAQPSGYASLDVSGRVPDIQIPDTIARDTEVAAAITTHDAVTDPHTGYLRDVMLPFSVAGPLALGAIPLRLYMNTAYTIVSVRATVGTLPVGSDVVVDVNKNGTSIWATNQVNRPRIPPAGPVTIVRSAFDTTALASGDYLTVDIDGIGSTTAGSYLVLQLTLRKVP